HHAGPSLSQRGGQVELPRAAPARYRRRDLAAMKLATRRRRIPLPGGGAVSAVVALPAGFRRPGRTPAVILAHGAGNDMTSPFMSTVHTGLAREGYVTVKVNFPSPE